MGGRELNVNRRGVKDGVTSVVVVVSRPPMVEL
jgi:hypothetical protein